MSIRADDVPAPGSTVSAASVAAADGPRNSCHGSPTPSSKPPFATCSGPVATGSVSLGLEVGDRLGAALGVGVGAGVLVGAGVGLGDGGAVDGAGVGGSARTSS